MARVSNTDQSAKKACLCAPTTHAGSFRCRLHRSQSQWAHPHPSASETEHLTGSSDSVSNNSSNESVEQKSKSNLALSKPPLPSKSRLSKVSSAESAEAQFKSSCAYKEHYPVCSSVPFLHGC